MEWWDPMAWPKFSECWALSQLFHFPLSLSSSGFLVPLHFLLFFGRNDANGETPVPRPPHAKSWLIGKDSDAGRDWGQKEKGTTEDEMAGWHHWLDGREFEWTPGVGDGQGGLASCNSWGHKESDMIERLNWTEGQFSSNKAFHIKLRKCSKRVFLSRTIPWKLHHTLITLTLRTPLALTLLFRKRSAFKYIYSLTFIFYPSHI